jgi:hypothetical protein
MFVLLFSCRHIYVFFDLNFHYFYTRLLLFVIIFFKKSLPRRRVRTSQKSSSGRESLDRRQCRAKGRICVLMWLMALAGGGCDCEGDNGGGTGRVGARHPEHSLRATAAAGSLAQVATREQSGCGGQRTYLGLLKPMARSGGRGSDVERVGLHVLRVLN